MRCTLILLKPLRRLRILACRPVLWRGATAALYRALQLVDVGDDNGAVEHLDEGKAVRAREADQRSAVRDSGLQGDAHAACSLACPRMISATISAWRSSCSLGSTRISTPLFSAAR